MSQSAFENLNLHKSWHDSAWLPILNSGNVLEYFSDRSNPFYDRQCNNEIIKMQRLNPEQLMNMQGTEYILLHFQDPIMYVVRQQQRYSPTQVTVIADYYIIAGVIYQAPDLNSVISSRLLNTVHNLGSAFEEAHSFSRYHPSKGYWWEFKDSAKQEKQLGKEKKKKRDYSGSTFQRSRVDALLKDFEMKFAVKRPPVFIPEKTDETVKIEPKIEIKTEKPSDRAAANSQPNVKPPPEKRPKMIR